MARLTASLKDPLASFILTVGTADMVIGGVGDRGSLLALGLLTVGGAALIGWRRAQARARRAAFWRARVYPSIGTGALPNHRDEPLGPPLQLPPPRRSRRTRQRRIY